MPSANGAATDVSGAREAKRVSDDRGPGHAPGEPTRMMLDRSAVVPNVAKIAVLRANGLGDLIVALPALDALRAAYPRANPMMRVGSPWDIAEACIYLSASSGKYITGETLTIDGGGQLWGETWTIAKPGYFGGDDK